MRDITNLKCGQIKSFEHSEKAVRTDELNINITFPLWRKSFLQHPLKLRI